MIDILYVMSIHMLLHHVHFIVNVHIILYNSWWYRYVCFLSLPFSSTHKPTPYRPFFSQRLRVRREHNVWDSNKFSSLNALNIPKSGNLAFHNWRLPDFTIPLNWQHQIRKFITTPLRFLFHFAGTLVVHGILVASQPTAASNLTPAGLKKVHLLTQPCATEYHTVDWLILVYCKLDSDKANVECI